MMHTLARIIVVAFSISLIACANIQSIGRTTTLPVSAQDGGVAIHLDAQQRLVLVKALGQYCAEPSPDALAAYASSLGLGVSGPSERAASLAQALQNSAGSIGLRTQSITLMRDALYRMCEAYSNGALGPVQVATLLGRSQDLTAVILAVEQLTGAVAANQIILTGTAGSGVAASLLSNQQLLDAARKDEEAKTKSLEEAKKERDTVKKAVDDKQVEEKTADDAYKKATEPNSTVSEAERTKLKAELDVKKSDLAQMEKDLAAAESQVKTKEALLVESRKTRETIENLKDSALTNAVANTSSMGQFSIPVQRKELSKDATEAIAKAVQGMVEKVLDKQYTQDSCMAILTNGPKDFKEWTSDQKVGFERIRDLCMQLVSRSLFEAVTKTEATFGPDATTELIEKALENDLTLKSRLNDWLVRNGLGISTTTLLQGKEYAGLRERAIKELAIP